LVQQSRVEIPHADDLADGERCGSIAEPYRDEASGGASLGRSNDRAEIYDRYGAPTHDGHPEDEIRGSDQALENIRAVLGARTKAVLLANHGVLTWHEKPEMAVMVGAMVEEAAEAAVFAEVLGGARVIPADLLRSSRDRMAAFESAGERRAEAAHKPHS